jgi:hypothetical protein
VQVFANAAELPPSGVAAEPVGQLVCSGPKHSPGGVQSDPAGLAAAAQSAWLLEVTAAKRLE